MPQVYQFQIITYQRRIVLVYIEAELFWILARVKYSIFGIVHGRILRLI